MKCFLKCLVDFYLNFTIDARDLFIKHVKFKGALNIVRLLLLVLFVFKSMQELFEKRPDLLRTQDIIYISLELNLTLLLFRLPFTACLRCYSISQFLFLLTIISIVLGAWHWLLVNFLYLSHHKIVVLSSLLVLFSFILCEVLRDD